MLDIYTIREELGTVNGLKIAMVGDLKNGRTVHSLVRLLSLYQVSLIFVAPPTLGMPESVTVEARKAGVSVTETTNLESIVGQADVLYVTRVQQERFASQSEYEAVKDAYIINNDLLSKAKPQTIVMHPLPRNAEIDPEVDFDQQRAACERRFCSGRGCCDETDSPFRDPRLSPDAPRLVCEDGTAGRSHRGWSPVVFFFRSGVGDILLSSFSLLSREDSTLQRRDIDYFVFGSGLTRGCNVLLARAGAARRPTRTSFEKSDGRRRVRRRLDLYGGWADRVVCVCAGRYTILYYQKEGEQVRVETTLSALDASRSI
jgi:Aspartate/ornithine carbamoyltransferase, Asp/Orn binding domain